MRSKQENAMTTTSKQVNGAMVRQQLETTRQELAAARRRIAELEGWHAPGCPGGPLHTVETITETTTCAACGDMLHEAIVEAEAPDAVPYAVPDEDWAYHGLQNPELAAMWGVRPGRVVPQDAYVVCCPYPPCDAGALNDSSPFWTLEELAECVTEGWALTCSKCERYFTVPHRR